MLVRIRAFFILIGLIISFSGCFSKTAEPKIDFQAPQYVQQMPSLETEDSDSLGSLYGSGNNPLFSDRKAMRINDIVTVLVTESASATSSGSKQLAKTQAGQLGPGAFTYAGASNLGKNISTELNNLGGFGVGYNSTGNFAGTGSSNRSENFSTTVSARVVKVMTNGNYFIEGRREILVNGEKQILQLSGVVRPYDINQNNQIRSTLMADAKILYKTEGDIDMSTQKGWGARILESVWPF